MNAIPIINLESIKPENLASRLLQVGQEPVFFYLTGHGIPPILLCKMFELSRNFFAMYSEEDRARFAAKSGEPGYAGTRMESLSGSGAGDMKESFHFESFSHNPSPLLPVSLSPGKELLTEFSAECERVGRLLLGALAIGLNKGATALTRHHTTKQNRFRFLHYPPINQNLVDSSEDIRAGAHSDYGSLTLLFQEPSDEGGLQVLHGGNWISVPHFENAIVINIGDALEFWTAGRLRSTVHRVIFPSVPSAQSRYSIPFFITADDDTILEPMLVTGEEERDQVDTLSSFQSVARAKGFSSLEPITAREYRLRRENVFGHGTVIHQKDKSHLV